MLRTASASLWLVLGSAAHAFPGGVRIVEPTGTQNFPDIASAVAAAPDGAVLLVGEGSYSAFTISGKSLSIFAAPGQDVEVTPPVLVTAIAANQTVVLSGIHVNPGYPQPPLSITNSTGIVRVQDSTSHAFDFDLGVCPGPLRSGTSAVSVSNASRVAFVNCTFTGGHGEGLVSDEDFHCAVAGDGGPGVQVTNGTIAFYDCIARGGTGGGHLASCGHGGAGIQIDGATMFASGSAFLGGGGGACFFPGACGGVGGDGCEILNAAAVTEVGCTFVGGSQGNHPCGANGQPVSGGTATSLSGPARVMSIAPFVAGDTDVWNVRCSGAAGDNDYLLESLSPAVQLAPAFNGAWLVKRSALLSAPFLGSGASVATTLPCPAIVSGSIYDLRFVQLAMRAPGSVYLGSGAATLVIDHTAGPDCDGDGVNDFVEVIDDPSTDVNHNLIPDTCPGG